MCHATSSLMRLIFPSKISFSIQGVRNNQSVTLLLCSALWSPLRGRTWMKQLRSLMQILLIPLKDLLHVILPDLQTQRHLAHRLAHHPVPAHQPTHHLCSTKKHLSHDQIFLRGFEDVYMWQPRGFEDPKFPNHVCKLRKAIYDLKQAPKAWFESLQSTLLKWGFYNTKGDTSLFIHLTKNTILIIIIYVDDILVTGGCEDELQKFTRKLNNTFSLKDLGDVHYFLGLKIIRDETCMFLSQKKYVQDLLDGFEMINCSTCLTPMVYSKQFYNRRV